MSVEVAKKEKKSKKSQKVEEVAMEVEDMETTVEEPTKKEKKKKKRSSEEAAETVTEEAAAETEEPAKKKKKKNKDAEEEAPAAEEAAEEEPKKKKKSKKTEEEPAAEEEKPASEEKTEEKPAEDGEQPQSTTVFIGGFPYTTSEETLKKDFEECGEIVNFRFPMNRDTGEPKGIAFATYASTEGVKKALEYNETDYGGRMLRVREADDNPPGDGGKGGKGKGKGKDGGKGGRVPGEKPEGCKGLIIKNLTYETTEDELWTLFKDFEDKIDRLNLLKDRDSGASKGIAFIDCKMDCLDSVDDMMKAKQNTDMNGRSIFIDWSGPKPDGKGKGKDGKGKDGKGKGKGKDGKGKGKKGKGKEPDAARAKTSGSIQAFAGKAQTFGDSDSD